MSTALIFPQTKKNKVFIGVLEVEATLTEDFTVTSNVSENPIEDGSSIQDHVSIDPLKYVLSGIISDDPLEPTQGLLGITERRFEAYEVLKNLLINKIELTLVTGLTVLNNMIMTSFTTSRSESTGRSIEFTCDFIQLKKATVKRTKINKAVVKKEYSKKVAKKIKKGKKTTTQTSVKATKKVSSSITITGTLMKINEKGELVRAS